MVPLTSPLPATSLEINGYADPAEAGGFGFVLVCLAFAGVYLVLLGPIALLIGRDAVRHHRDGWLWALLFLWQPVFVGLIYLVLRRRPRKQSTSGPG